MDTKLIDEVIKKIPKRKRKVKNVDGEEICVFGDEVYIEVLSGMGSLMLSGALPREMIRDFIMSYIKTDTWRYVYLFIDGKEISNEFVQKVLED